MSRALRPAGVHRWSAEHLGQQHKPHRPAYVSTGSRYAGPLVYRPMSLRRRVGRLIGSMLVAFAVAATAAGLVVLAVWETVAHA